MRKNKLLKILIIVIGIPIILIGSLSIYAVTAMGMTLPEIFLPLKMIESCNTDDGCSQYCNSNLTECIDVLERVNEVVPALAAYAFDKFNTIAPGLTITEFIADMRFRVKMRASEDQTKFCNDVEYFPDCIDYMARYTPSVFTPKELANNQTLARALRDGAKLPGGRTNVLDLKPYCLIPANVEECTTWAKQYYNIK